MKTTPKTTYSDAENTYAAHRRANEMCLPDSLSTAQEDDNTYETYVKKAYLKALTKAANTAGVSANEPSFSEKDQAAPWMSFYHIYLLNTWHRPENIRGKTKDEAKQMIANSVISNIIGSTRHFDPSYQTKLWMAKNKVNIIFENIERLEKNPLSKEMNSIACRGLCTDFIETERNETGGLKAKL